MVGYVIFMSSPKGDMLRLYKKGQEEPVWFVENIIGMTELWEKQAEIMRSVRDNSRTVVRSCNGAGKTFTTANVVAWFLTTHPNSIVVSTAPTARQVKELLWAEINNIYANSKYPLGGRCLNLSWTLGEKWYALGLSTNEPDRFQGFHAEHILGVIDEGAGVDAPIWEGMDAILTSEGARLLAIGNPTEPSGNFHEVFKSPLYNKIKISAFDTPNFTRNGITLEDIKNDTWKEKIKEVVYPALVTPKWVSERYQEWGEKSPAFQSRILGEFPDIGTDTLIPLSYVANAMERDHTDYQTGDRTVISIDVARFGDDSSVIGVRKGKCLNRYRQYHGLDVYNLAKQARAFIIHENPDYTIVDTNGIGSGVADILRGWGFNVIEHMSQNRAYNHQKFFNRRTESWYKLRELMRTEEINLPADDELLGQLTAVKYEYDTKGRYKLESKDKMKDRGLPSPDIADMVVMAFEFDDDYETSIAKDSTEEEAKPGTVKALLQELERGQVSELEWHHMKF